MSIFDAIKKLFGFNSSPRTASPNDRLLNCEDCGQEFVFDEGEQRFFKIKGFTDPKRCPRCRKKVKFRLRKKGRSFHQSNSGGDRDRGHQNNNSHHRNNKSRGRSLIDGLSPYVDER